MLVALTSLTMVLPNLAAQELGPLYNKPQLIFAALVSLVLYFAFVFIQTVRHRDYFLPVKTSNPEEHVPPPDNRTTALSAVLLVVSLIAVVGLAKVLTPTVETRNRSSQVPKAVVGTIIAALVLLPEAVAAIKAARSNRLQTSLNLALGSALATIGLTIPAVAAVSIALRQPPRTRAGRKRARTAGVDAASQRDHSGNRPDDGASGHRAFGHLCRVSVFCGGAVSCRSGKAARMSAFGLH